MAIPICGIFRTLPEKGARSESISTDYAACMQGTVVSTSSRDRWWHVDKCTIITYFGMASYSSVQVEEVLSQSRTIAYAGKRSDITTSFPNFAVGQRMPADLYQSF